MLLYSAIDGGNIISTKNVENKLILMTFCVISNSL